MEDQLYQWLAIQWCVDPPILSSNRYHFDDALKAGDDGDMRALLIGLLLPYIEPVAVLSHNQSSLHHLMGVH
jgi:hypothetical protein